MHSGGLSVRQYDEPDRKLVDDGGLSFVSRPVMVQLSLVLRKPVIGVSDQVLHNRAVQPQRIARGLKFQI